MFSEFRLRDPNVSFRRITLAFWVWIDKCDVCHVQNNGIAPVIAERYFVDGGATLVVLVDSVCVRSGVLTHDQIARIEACVSLMRPSPTGMILISDNEHLLMSKPHRHAVKQWAGEINHRSATLKQLGP